MYPHSVAAAAKSLYESATKAVAQVSTEVEAIFNTFKSSSDDLKVLQQLPQSIGKIRIFTQSHFSLFWFWTIL